MHWAALHCAGWQNGLPSAPVGWHRLKQLEIRHDIYGPLLFVQPIGASAKWRTQKAAKTSIDSYRNYCPGTMHAQGLLVIRILRRHVAPVSRAVEIEIGKGQGHSRYVGWSDRLRGGLTEETHHSREGCSEQGTKCGERLYPQLLKRTVGAGLTVGDRSCTRAKGRKPRK